MGHCFLCSIKDPLLYLDLFFKLFPYVEFPYNKDNSVTVQRTFLKLYDLIKFSKRNGCMKGTCSLLVHLVVCSIMSIVDSTHHIVPSAFHLKSIKAVFWKKSIFGIKRRIPSFFCQSRFTEHFANYQTSFVSVELLYIQYVITPVKSKNHFLFTLLRLSFIPTSSWRFSPGVLKKVI